MKTLGNWFKPNNIIGFSLIAFFAWIYFKFLKKTEFTPYDSIAESQYEAMRDYGTDEELLFSTLKELNAPDLRQVYKSFGKRTYRSGGAGIPFLIGQNTDLFGWYANELNESEREKMKSIWNKTGMKLTF